MPAGAPEVRTVIKPWRRNDQACEIKLKLNFINVSSIQIAPSARGFGLAAVRARVNKRFPRARLYSTRARRRAIPWNLLPNFRAHGKDLFRRTKPSCSTCVHSLTNICAAAHLWCGRRRCLCSRSHAAEFAARACPAAINPSALRLGQFNRP